MLGRILLVTGAVALAAASFTSIASADECLGLDCPGVTPAASAAHGLMQAVAKPQDLEAKRTTGFFDFGTNGPTQQRAVAFVVAPGDWNAAPDEIKQLPAADAVTATERANNTLVFYGPRVVVSVPSAIASAARKHSKKKSTKAHTASFSDCPSGWFCLFDDYNGTGAMGKWSDTGYWQNLTNYGWQSRGTSMNNRRNGYTLLERYDGAHYCAIPNSQDGSLANNGYNNNTLYVYLSTATTWHSGWNCTN